MRFVFYILVFIILWFFLACMSLIYRKNHTIKLFKAMEKVIKLQYEIILRILSIIKNNIKENDKIIEETENYIKSTENIPSDDLNIDRKLGINALVIKNFKLAVKNTEIYPGIVSSEEFLSAQQKLRELNGLLVLPSGKYNASAYKLKHMVEVFPTSFIARLLDIKTLDTL